VVEAPLVAVVTRTGAMARLPCAVAMLALQATRPEEEEVTVAVTVVAAVVPLEVASTHTERQSTRTKTHTP
jgi:hypothetical protein